jgi:hypothetical protein
MESAEVAGLLAVGDRVTLAGSGHSPSSPNLSGEIVEVAGRAGCGVYRVRWADGQETMLASSAVSDPWRVRQPGH